MRLGNLKKAPGNRREGQAQIDVWNQHDRSGNPLRKWKRMTMVERERGGGGTILEADVVPASDGRETRRQETRDEDEDER